MGSILSLKHLSPSLCLTSVNRQNLVNFYVKSWLILNINSPDWLLLYKKLL